MASQPASEGSTLPDNEPCILPASILNAHGLIHLRESVAADLSILEQRLRTGDYSKPFIMDDGVTRSLHFSPAFVQSEMSLDQPRALSLAYVRKMTGFLLFQSRPRHVIIVGLGGGSLTKFCRQALPHARITTVEIDADVIGFSAFFDVPAPDEKTHIVHADAVEYFANTKERADVILLDGCDANGIAPAFGTRNFYRSLRSRLSPGGVLVANLVGADRVETHRNLIRETFAERLIVHHVASEGNYVAFAFNDPGWAPDWPAINRQAGKLARRYGLDFPGFARKLQRSYERGPSADTHATVCLS